MIATYNQKKSPLYTTGFNGINIAVENWAKDSKFYKIPNGSNWYYVVKDRAELDLIISGSNWLTSHLQTAISEITDAYGVTKSISMQALITTRVTNFDILFENQSQFRQFIPTWDTRRVTSAIKMFSGASSLVTAGTARWDMSNCNNMEGMFKDAAMFNENLSNWCVEHIPTEPNQFSTGASSWILPKPNWGQPC